MKFALILDSKSGTLGTTEYNENKNKETKINDLNDLELRLPNPPTMISPQRTLEVSIETFV